MNQLINFINLIQVLANAFLFGLSGFGLSGFGLSGFGTLSANNFFIIFYNVLRIVETMQVFDIIFSMTKVVKSNPLITLIQIGAKLIITYYGSDYYRNILAMVWSFSDFIRYAYYLMPNIQILKKIRFSQYKYLYPIGMCLEYLNIIPSISNLYLKYIILGAYLTIGPIMYNNTSKMETHQYIMDSLTKKSINPTNPTDPTNTDIIVLYKNTTYNINKDILNRLNGSRFKWKLLDEDSNKYELKDYGIQISWRKYFLYNSL